MVGTTRVYMPPCVLPGTPL